MRPLAILAVLFAGCSSEPDKKNRAVIFARDLQDITRWDRLNGAPENDGFCALLGLDPKDSAPALMSILMDPTPTHIDDRIHNIPTVGDVAFQMLLIIFKLPAESFADEGVWIGTDPINNPIYNVHLDTDEVRGRVQRRFAFLAKQRGWMD